MDKAKMEELQAKMHALFNEYEIKSGFFIALRDAGEQKTGQIFMQFNCDSQQALALMHFQQSILTAQVAKDLMISELGDIWEKIQAHMENQRMAKGDKH